mmetsp:Transcript_60864/g.191355  ORF Transcript_60864/g.191355 Transcript_60864/m.191355 type:complete len:340 (-) Transcript_60864:487-1506(-)
MDGALPLLAHHDLEALPAILADLEQVREAEAIEVHGRGLPLGPGAGDVALLREGARLGYQDLQDGVVLGASGRPQPLPQHLDLGPQIRGRPCHVPAGHRSLLEPLVDRRRVAMAGVLEEADPVVWPPVLDVVRERGGGGLRVRSPLPIRGRAQGLDRTLVLLELALDGGLRRRLLLGRLVRLGALLLEQPLLGALAPLGPPCGLELGAGYLLAAILVEGLAEAEPLLDLQNRIKHAFHRLVLPRIGEGQRNQYGLCQHEPHVLLARQLQSQRPAELQLNSIRPRTALLTDALLSQGAAIALWRHASELRGLRVDGEAMKRHPSQCQRQRQLEETKSRDV